MNAKKTKTKGGWDGSHEKDRRKISMMLLMVIVTYCVVIQNVWLLWKMPLIKNKEARDNKTWKQREEISININKDEERQKGNKKNEKRK